MESCVSAASCISLLVVDLFFPIAMPAELVRERFSFDMWFNEVNREHPKTEFIDIASQWNVFTDDPGVAEVYDTPRGLMMSLPVWRETPLNIPNELV